MKRRGQDSLPLSLVIILDQVDMESVHQLPLDKLVGKRIVANPSKFLHHRRRELNEDSIVE